MPWWNPFSSTPDIAAEDAEAEPDLMAEAYEAEAAELEGEPVEVSAGDYYTHADPGVYIVAEDDYNLLNSLLGL